MPESDASHDSTATAESHPTPWAPLLFPSLIACVLGGAIGCAIIHTIDPYFKYADLPELGISPSAELVKKHNDAQRAFQSRNLGLNFGILGLCIGLATGMLATGRRRIASGVAGALGGLVGGGVAGYVVGLSVAKALIASADQSLLQSSGLHFAVWASALVCLLWMVGCVQDGVVRAMGHIVTGLLLGCVVAVTYNVASSAIFPSANLILIVPKSVEERIVWILICATTIGLGLHFGMRSKNKKPA